MRTCDLETCNDRHKGHGLCGKHLQRLKRTGTTDDPIIVRPLEERFWEKVDKDGPLPARQPELGACWLWTSATNEHGYGVIRPEGKRSGPGLKAHRLSAAWAGMDVDDRHVLHACDNPPCVNPAHLRPGTPADNAADRSERDRVSFGEGSGSAKLTEAQAVEIFRRRSAGESRNALAAEFGISGSVVTGIAAGRGWARATAADRAVVESITGEEIRIAA